MVFVLLLYISNYLYHANLMRAILAIALYEDDDASLTYILTSYIVVDAGMEKDDDVRKVSVPRSVVNVATTDAVVTL